MTYENEYLAHHGILGQKWGIRRYQNADGSLTAEGRKRRGYSDQPAGKSVKDKISQHQKERKIKKAREKRALEAARAKRSQELIEEKAKRQAEAHERLKENLRRHPRDIYKNRDRLTKEDLDEIMKGIEWDRKCADIRRDEYKRFLNKAEDFNATLKNINSALVYGTNIYNNTALIYNGFAQQTGRKQWPQLAWAKKDDQRDDKKGEQKSNKKGNGN